MRTRGPLLCAMALLAGCGGAAVGPRDGGAGEAASDRPGLDAAAGDAMNDAAGDAAGDGTAGAFAGLRAFVVTSTVSIERLMPEIPRTHTFTLVLDGDAHRAYVGSADGHHETKFALDGAGDAFELDEPFQFSFGKCGTALSYDSIRFTLTPDGQLSGTGLGLASYILDNRSQMTGATMSFAGVADTVPPSLAPEEGATLTDPFLPFELFASEPLPRGVTPTLVSADGGASALLEATDLNIASDHTQFAFGLPRGLLRYGESYRVNVDDIVDFAGNRAGAGLAFTTRAAPPLVAEDGFESVAGTTFGGAQVVEGGPPVITGTKSLSVPPSGPYPGTPGPQGLSSQLILRLAVSPGDTVIRFSYRTTSAGVTIAGVSPPIGVASVGSSITWVTLPEPPGAPSIFPLLPDVMIVVSPVAQAEIPLPADVHDEVILDRVVGFETCGMPAPSLEGIVIDDLRVE